MSKLDEFFANKNWEFEDDWNYIGDIDPQEAYAELAALEADRERLGHENMKQHLELLNQDNELAQLRAELAAMRKVIEAVPAVREYWDCLWSDKTTEEELADGCDCAHCKLFRAFDELPKDC